MSDDTEDNRPSSSAFTSVDPQRNFSLPIGERIRALTIGAPAYAARKKQIEDLEAAHLKALIAVHDKIAASGDPLAPRLAVRAVEEKAALLDVKKLNALIDTHNRYYPIEANLPVNPRTGAYLIYGRPWKPESPWTAAAFVELALAKVAARESSNDE